MFKRIFIIVWFNEHISVISDDVFLMTSTKCITNSTLPMLVSSNFSNHKEAAKMTGQKKHFFTNFNDGNCSLFCADKWTIVTSSDELITDIRWKDLRTYTLPRVDLNLTHNINNTKLPISVRSEIFEVMFCEKESSNSICIFFTFTSDTAGLRICIQNDKRNCTRYVEKETNKSSKKWTSNDYWNHLMFEKNDSAWKVMLNNHEIFSYNHTSNLKITKILILGPSNGLIKIHESTHLYSNETGVSHFGPKINITFLSCLKFKIRMCEKCSLVLTVNHDQKTVTKNKYFHQTDQTTTWKEIQIPLSKLNDSVLIYLEKISNQQKNMFWAIDDILPCKEKGIKSINRNRNEYCELIDPQGNPTISVKKYNEGIVQLKELTYEEEENYYRNCTDEMCGKSKVCKISVKTFNVTCYCPLGFKMVNETMCQPCKRSYGWNCRDNCEGCSHGCSVVGLCIHKNDTRTCKSKEYKGPYCNINPEAPNRSNTTVSWNTDNNITAVIKWIYQNLIENKIRKFELDVNDQTYAYYDINKNKTNFSKVVVVQPEKLIKFRLRACNRTCSESTLISLSSPPLKAKIKQDKIKCIISNQQITITLPVIEKICKKCNTTILLALTNSTEDVNFENYTVWKFNYENYLTNSKIIFGRDNKTYTSYLKKTIEIPPFLYTNCKLAVRVINSFEGQENTATKIFNITENKTQENIKTNFVTIAITSSLLLLLTVFAAIFVYFRRNNITCGICIPSVSNNQEQPADDVIGLLNTTSNPNVRFKSPLKAGTKNIQPYKMPGTTRSKMVLLARFESYIKCSLEKNDLENQHNSFPKGLQFPCSRASLQENKSKNRYGNILAYDHSRVVLETIDDDEYSDYINANYIDGYHTTNAYIAAQGPKENTIDDFWRMIWQENIRNIVMIGNVLETGKKKLPQYWPEINKLVEFRNIHVTQMLEKVHANYVSRQFLVTLGDETREVDHLQFTSWPNHGVPFYAESLVPFLKIMSEIQLDSVSPILVHCSAGVGKTGTILLCDMTLRLANAEGRIDIINCMEYLRSRRPNLVDNYEQYKLVHLVVLECLFGLNTNILCDDNVICKVTEVISSDIEAQMAYLKNIEWHDDIMGLSETADNLYGNSNEEGTSTDISTVYVEGYQEPNRFIATRRPHTVSDFWGIIVEMKCTEIISLNEGDPKQEMSCKFWPENEDVLKLTKDIYIEHVKTHVLDTYQVFCFSVCNKEESWQINLISFKNWSSNESIPSNLEEFVSFCRETDFYLRKSKPIIVTCSDGITACGLFLALLFVIDKINFEQVIDVCQAVRYIRHNRKAFIAHKDQFVFLYRAALQYMKKFEMYANFS